MQHLAVFTASTLFAFGMTIYAAGTMLESFRQVFNQTRDRAAETGGIINDDHGCTCHPGCAAP